ncbi:MAG: monomeric [FeFe] hydrogenase [Salinivirgaceae bacterium]
MTPNKNNASIIRKDLLIRLTRGLLQQNSDSIDRIPIVIKPRGRDPWRCCVYKDRAVLKYKVMSILGYAECDEVDELAPLSWYAHRPRGHQKFYLNLIPESCSNCPSGSYVVTNLCRGCEARPCQMNCPKDAITFKNGQAEINSELCINCGKCMRECPYNAIHFQPRPCEDVCPVDAISQTPDGNEEIDKEKCILCGKCMQACPFGAIIPSSDLPQLVQHMNANEELVAIVAPAVNGQFRGSLEQIYSGINACGFTHVYEVAEGAEQTALLEANELSELIQNKEHPGLMSSCCPAWVDYVNKKQSLWRSSVSHAASPMAISAKIAKEKHPNARVVFIGPCIAKKAEVSVSEHVDYAISFEELGALLVASEVEIADLQPFSTAPYKPDVGRKFAAAGGVAGAISQKMEQNITIYSLDGITKPAMRQMTRAVKEQKIDFFEVMCCEGGCLGGSQTLTSVAEAQRIIQSKPD